VAFSDFSKNNSVTCAVFGASGYSGAELARILHNHPHFSLAHVFCSTQASAQSLSTLYPALFATTTANLQLKQWTPEQIDTLDDVAIAFLALPHDASTILAPQLVARGIRVFDLSGAFRLRDTILHQQHYGFSREAAAPYGLSEYYAVSGEETLVAVPGCYPTVTSLSLLPFMPHKANHCTPVVNAVSGVTGAGRKASLTTQFAEVSLQAYGVGTHRHQPEIAQTLGCDLVFTPHLGAFKRGIYATAYLELSGRYTTDDLTSILQQTYLDKPFVRVSPQPPKLDDVVHTPFCQLAAAAVNNHADASGALVTGVVVTGVIDNLLKGAASQAVQLANRVVGYPETAGLIG